MKYAKVLASVSLMIFLLTELASVYLPAAQEEEMPREKTLILEMDMEQAAPEILNPYLPGYAWWSGTEMGHIWENLWYANWFNTSITPWLAESWEYDESYTKMTVHLRDGVYWSDGEPFTADDVVFTYNMLFKYPQLAYSAQAKDYVKEVKKIDRLTVVFELNYPNPRFHIFQAGTCGYPQIVPEHIWSKVDPTTYNAYPDPVGTGPYQLISAISTRYIYKRRPKYWAKDVFGKYPEPEYVVYQYFGPLEKRLIAFAGGEADYTHDIGRPEFEDLVKKNPYYRAFYKNPPYALTHPCVRYIGINNRIYPFNILEVRWALSYGIDRARVLNVAYRNTTRSWPALVSTPQGNFPEMVKDVCAEYNATEYNPQKSIQIFESIGFKRGADGIWVTPNGTRLELEIIAPAPWVETVKYGEVAADCLKEIGVDAYVKKLDVPAFSDMWSYRTFTGGAMWLCAGMSDAYYSLEYYHSKYNLPIGIAFGTSSYNDVGYVNPEYDKLVDELRSIPSDGPRGIEIQKELTRMLNRDMVALPLNLANKLLTFNEYYWTNWPVSNTGKYEAYTDPYDWCKGWVFAMLSIKSTGRLPPGLMSGPFGVMPQTQYYMIYTGIAATVVIILGASYWALKRRRTPG